MHDTYRPFLFGRCAEGTEDGLQLIHIAFAGKIGRAQHELREDTADRPDVYGGTVIPTAKEQFRWSIPSAEVAYQARTAFVYLGARRRGSRARENQGRIVLHAPRDHLTGHFVAWVRSVTGQTKICEFQLPV